MSDAKKTANQPTFGQHKDGSYYLRATSPDQAGAIQDAAEKHGLALSHRKDPAMHEGQKGVFSHFHFSDPEHGQTILDELRTLHAGGTADPADDAGKDLAGKEEGGAAPAAPKETHVHVHLHEGEDVDGAPRKIKKAEDGGGGEEGDEEDEGGDPRQIQKAHGYTRTHNGKLIQVHDYATRRQAAMNATNHAHGTSDEALASRQTDHHLTASNAHLDALRQHTEAREVAPTDVAKDHSDLMDHHRAAAAWHSAKAKGATEPFGVKDKDVARGIAKAHVAAHTRTVNGKVVEVREHDDNRAKAVNYTKEANASGREAYRLTSAIHGDPKATHRQHNEASEAHAKAVLDHRDARLVAQEKGDHESAAYHDEMSVHHSNAHRDHQSRSGLGSGPAPKDVERAHAGFKENYKDDDESGRKVAKAHVEAHTRTMGGKVVQVHGYDTKHPGPKSAPWHFEDATHRTAHPGGESFTYYRPSKRDPGGHAANTVIGKNADPNAWITRPGGMSIPKDAEERQKIQTQDHSTLGTIHSFATPEDERAHEAQVLDAAPGIKAKIDARKTTEKHDPIASFPKDGMDHEAHRAWGKANHAALSKMAKESGAKADASGKDEDHAEAAKFHDYARHAHLRARDEVGPIGSAEDDPHAHAAMEHSAEYRRHAGLKDESTTDPHKEAQAASDKAHSISGKEPVDHEAAEEAHGQARTAHLEARGADGPMGTPEEDPHGHAAAHHEEQMLHHREAHQTTIHEAIGEADQKTGDTEETYRKAAMESHRHTKGLDMGGGIAPTAENHYAAHEAHTAAAHAAREHAKVDPKYTEAAERHEKDASWQKFLGDSKMKAREKGTKGRKVAKGLDSYLQSADLLNAAQQWYVSRLNAFHMGMGPMELPAFAAVKQAVKDAACCGLDHDQVMDCIYMATGGASAYTQAVTEWLNA